MLNKKLFLFVLFLSILFTSSAHAEEVFKTNLRLGSKGDDVKKLQQYLNTQGFQITEKGPGSPGNETTLFGGLTKKALAKFQEKFHDDILKPSGLKKGTGNFFTSTRNFVNKTLTTNPTPLTNSKSGYTVGGMVTGITGSIIISNNIESLTLSPGMPANFVFSKRFKTGESYKVSITKTPDNQQCFMKDSKTSEGIIGSTDISNIIIQCNSVGSQNPFNPITVSGRASYTLGGTVSGLVGGTLVLREQNGGTVSLSQNGTFTFSSSIGAGAQYGVSVLTNPTGPDETCVVSNGSGTMNANVTNVQVVCTTTRTPEASIVVSPTSIVDGGGSLVYTVTLDQLVTSNTSVNFSISGTAVLGSDYTTQISPLVIPAGETTGIITLPTIANTTIEEDRTLTVTLRTGAGYALEAPTSATATITNNNTQTGRFLYIEYDGTEFIFTADDNCDCLILNPIGPMTLVNNDTSTPLNVIFVGDWVPISNSTMYIIAGSDNIRFGRQTVAADGEPFTVTINNVSNYGGLISNSSGYEDIQIANIFVKKTGSSTLANGGGWILRSNSSNTTIVNSSSNGNVSTNGGGIVGSNAENVRVLGSFNTGSIIGANGGGIVGTNAQNVTVENSYSTGNISFNAGGIIGSNACASSDSCTNTVTRSFSTGTIGATDNYNAGGIFGNNVCNSATNCTATVNYSYSTGQIFGDDSGSNGGIVGANAQNTGVNYSHSNGSIGKGGGGIFGPYTSNSSANNSYSTGNIDVYGGGIFGLAAASSTATNTYSTGNIGTQGGGIFGYASDSSSVSNSFSLGTLGADAGSIFGADGNNIMNINCYSLNSPFLGANVFGIILVNCISEEGGPWSDVNAVSALQGTASWSSPSINTPYEFAPISERLAIPYSVVSVNDDGSYNFSLNNNFRQTVEKGGNTVSALSGYDTFSIVTINNESPSDFPEISIDANTGEIDTTLDVDAGTYEIVVRHHQTFGNTGTYNSLFTLIVNN